jgi:hypothetical protein
MAPQGQLYKIKLSSGRVLGPFNLERVRVFISKKKITGVETAREYPQGEWQDINLIPALSGALMEQASGNLDKESIRISVQTSLPGAAGVLSVPEKTLTEVETLTSLSAAVKTVTGPSVNIGVEPSIATSTVTQILEEQEQEQEQEEKELEESTPVYFPLEEEKRQKLSDHTNEKKGDE